MKTIHTRALGLALLGIALAMPGAAKPHYFVAVAIYDVKPGQSAAFEAMAKQTIDAVAAARGFYNDRLLRNIDPLAYHYASYTKSTDRAALEKAVRERIAALQPFLRRDPEVHIAQPTKSYYLNPNATFEPGTEFGHGQIGQIAHIGLFIPYPNFRPDYDRTIDHVKVYTRDRRPQGYFGEDLLYEADDVSAEAQTPYTPHAAIPARMSINYGEYRTFEDAENSYIKRAGDRPRDPQVVVWERVFYSSIQVPARFFIYQVIANTSAEPRRPAHGRPTESGR